MGKKKFKSSFDDLLRRSTQIKKPTKLRKEVVEEIKSTFIVKVDQLDKIKAISYMERKMIKNILDDAFALYIKHYEEQNGTVALPKK